MQTISAFDGDDSVTQFVDRTGQRLMFYLVRYYDPEARRQTDPVLTFFPLTPKELRLTHFLKQWVPDIIAEELDEPTVAMAFRFALNTFNNQPPETQFAMDNFPEGYEQYLVFGAQVNVAMVKFLRFGIQDFSYSDMGFSLNVDRGAKIMQAAEMIGKGFADTLKLVKLNFMSMGLGQGTVPLNIGAGGIISPSALNILDIMSMQTR